ncbi:protein PNS1-like isoform X2 [Phalaenopsis equestris]|uniref:protein PNS1-like isoform X2 n=1 Tax=Phalaenopsis equestris TaxID=78828 RepID=UPI0009E375D0|nr:protein PNS1-like isoform X2 [Phalaenopsis equestris]
MGGLDTLTAEDKNVTKATLARGETEGKAMERQAENAGEILTGGEEVLDLVQSDSTVSRLRAQPQVPPIQVVSRNAAAPPPITPPLFQPVQTPPFQASMASLNSRKYTNRITLLIFLLHLAAAMAAVGFLSFKAVQGVLEQGTGKSRRERRALKFWLPPIEGASLLGIILAFVWQWSFRAWPAFMVRFALWACFLITMASGILLLCFSMPDTDAGGIFLLLFSIGTGIYACWVPRRASFSGRIFAKSLQPVHKFPGVNGPAYLMMGLGFIWISLWCFAVIGALEFYYPPLTIFALVLSLMWTAEVMRNVANITVSRVIALYYLRGMQCNIQFSFQRAASLNLGSACLGSLFVPSIEALRIIARGLNLLEGEDEFLFSCAHCCLRVMESIFRYGNSWAFVHIAAYGKGFVAASQSTWDLFNRQGMEELVDSDITSSICFLTGVSSGALCVIFSAPWTFSTHRRYTMTVSLVAFFVGYLMTRIGMALPQACVACFYVCYAENPGSQLFESIIPERIAQIRATIREGLVSTPRFVPRRVSTA